MINRIINNTIELIADIGIVGGFTIIAGLTMLFYKDIIRWFG